MKNPEFTSGAAPQIAAYVRGGRAAGSLCDGYVKRLHLFDAMCAERFPDEDRLTQEMLDEWCAKKPGEEANSCRARCYPVVSMVKFLQKRGETGLVAPDLPRRVDTGRSPHAFTDDELTRFFAECDSYRPNKGPGEAVERNRRTFPVLFRLLYSSGIRTCEARLLSRENVDLEVGVLRIVEGKGKSERLVALHPSMVEIMRRYDALMDDAFPGRAYFFPNGIDGHLNRRWVSYHFRNLWARVSDEPATAPQLRHQYAVENINSLVSNGIYGLADMEYLSKSMGHATMDETVRSYYHIVPALAEALQERCGDAFDGIVPEVM